VSSPFLDLPVVSKHLIRIVSNAGLKSDTGYSNAELWLVDLSDFSSVRAFVDRAVEDLERLDILLLNAAVLPREDGLYTSTKDGYETTYVSICLTVKH
jgi:NAD(P)-dependent dehydrogenase (short-subunit alcohol dehydrogenase family)